MHRLIRYIMLLTLLAVATPALAVYRTPVVFTNASSAKGQAMTQIDSAALRASGVIASDSCADVAFYDATGSTKLNHWFETACPAPPGSKTNVWIETAVPTGATTVLMLSGADRPQTGNELPWSGSFVLANGQDNCPGGWNLKSEMADYFPLPGATWGTVSPGGHSHHVVTTHLPLDVPGLQTSGIDNAIDHIWHTQTVYIDTKDLGEAGLPPWVRVPFCGKGKLDIVAGQMALFTGSLPAGSSAEPSQQGRFWRGSAGPFGETGGAADHQHTDGKIELAVQTSMATTGGTIDINSGHQHYFEITTLPDSSLPSHADFVPGRLAAGFNSFDAGGMTLFADQPPPLGWQPYATADNYYLRLADGYSAPVNVPHNHGQALESFIVGPSFQLAPQTKGGNDIGTRYGTPALHTHGYNPHSTSITSAVNAPPAFGVQLYQRVSQAGVTAAVGQSAVGRTLTITKDGLGLVTSSPGGISCGSSCSGLFNEGASVTLSATPDTGSVFTGWSGGGCSTSPTCTVTISSDITVTATFKKVHFDVTAPSSVPTNTPFSVTVTAKDPSGALLSGYSGMVQFTSSDPAATLPGISPITNGTATFNGLQFATPGTRTLTVAAAVPTDTLTGHWTFNEGSSTVAQDSSASDWDGTLTNIARSQDIPPFIQFENASSIEFNGSSSYVYLDRVKTPNTLTPNFTIQTWIKPAVLDKPQVLFSNGMCNVNCPTLQLGIGGDANCSPGTGVPGKINFLIETTTAKYNLAQTQDSTLNPNEWRHAAVTYDGTAIKLYINGVLDNSVPATGTLAGDYYYTLGADPALDFGCKNPDGTPLVRSAYSGKMDDLRIYNRALSPVEIAMAAGIVTGEPNSIVTIPDGMQQTITVTTPTPTLLDKGTSFTVKATASSGLPVIYSSGSPSVCTNNGAIFTVISSSGSCIVQYDQPGNVETGGSYGPAPQVTSSTSVMPLPPVVMGISPVGGPAAGGTNVTITGYFFTGATQVLIGGIPVTAFTVASATTITATTPAGTAGAKDVTVITPQGSMTAAGLFTYYPPAVSAITPASGPAAGGTPVTISGANFSGAARVAIGGVAATGVTLVNSTTITAITPAGTAGAKDVTVTTPSGSATGAGLFSYDLPAVSAITPRGGPLAGGTPVTISGVNFTGATAVTIGGTAVTSFSVASATTITATTPAGTAGVKDVVVTTPQGSMTGAALFTYGLPLVSAITPASGPAAGGTPVTITGINFSGATQVFIGGAAVTGFTVVSDSSITATTAAAATGSGDVTITTPQGSGTGAGLFSYYRYRTPITIDNSGAGNSSRTQALLQLDSATLRASGVIASDSCADVAFFDQSGTTRLKHWFETACPALPGGKSNVWIEADVAAGASRTVTMVSGSAATSGELPWSGSFVLANGQDNCPGGWNLKSEMADYFPRPGATWGAVSAGGHSHNLTFQTNGDTGTGVPCDSGVEHDSDEISTNTHTWNIDTPPIGEAGLPPWVRVPFCGKGKLDIVAGQMALFSGSLPAGSSAEPSQQGRFWRGSAGPFGETGGAATHQHTASGKSSVDSGGLAVNVGPGPFQVLYHRHEATVTTQPASSLPSHADFVPGRLAAGFNSFDAGGMTLFADQPPPLGWQPYAMADNYYLRLADGYSAPVAQTPHDHGTALASSTVSNALSFYILRVDNIPFYTCTSAHHTHILHTSSTSSTAANAPPAFGVQLYQRVSQAGVTVTVGQSEVVLTVTIEGSGTVNSYNQATTNYACNKVSGGVCDPMVFAYNDTVKLAATGSNSTLTGWSGAITGSANPYTGLIMNGNKDVKATFVTNPAKVKIEGDVTLYYTLGAALNAAQPPVLPALATVILARGAPEVFNEDVVLNNPIKILLKGGHDAGFVSQGTTDYTTISGSLKIQGGQLIVDRLNIK